MKLMLPYEFCQDATKPCGQLINLYSVPVYVAGAVQESSVDRSSTQLIPSLKREPSYCLLRQTARITIMQKAEPPALVPSLENVTVSSLYVAVSFKKIHFKVLMYMYS